LPQVDFGNAAIVTNTNIVMDNQPVRNIFKVSAVSEIKQ
jgi:hypothetical protein